MVTTSLLEETERKGRQGAVTAVKDRDSVEVLERPGLLVDHPSHSRSNSLQSRPYSSSPDRRSLESSEPDSCRATTGSSITMSSLLEHIDQDYNSGQEDDEKITSSDEDQNGRDYVSDDEILQFNPSQTAEQEKGTRKVKKSSSLRLPKKEKDFLDFPEIRCSLHSHFSEKHLNKRSTNSKCNSASSSTDSIHAICGSNLGSSLSISKDFESMEALDEKFESI